MDLKSLLNIVLVFAVLVLIGISINSQHSRHFFAEVLLRGIKSQSLKIHRKFWFSLVFGLYTGLVQFFRKLSERL